MTSTRLTPWEVLDRGRSVAGRTRLLAAARAKAAPVVRVAAAAHRRTLSRGVRIVAVTGSFGKTTTTRAIAAVLGVPAERAMRLALNGLWDVPAQVLALPRHRRHAVMEVGIDRPGQMGPQATALRPDVAVVTSVGGEHLETLRSLDVVAEEKVRLVRSLRPGGLAVVNGDDPRVRGMADGIASRRCSYGFGADCDVRALDVTLDWPHGMRLRMSVHGARCELRTRQLGRQMVPPLLAALAVATAEGVDLQAALGELGTLVPADGRLELRAVTGDIWPLCDYRKNSLQTLLASVDLLAAAPGRRLLVSGPLRPYTSEIAPLLPQVAGAIARSMAAVVLVGDGQDDFAAALLAAGLASERLHRAWPGVRDAQQLVRRLMRAGDTLLLAGRQPHKLERLALALAGRVVRCDLGTCALDAPFRADCANLATDWRARVRL